MLAGHPRGGEGWDQAAEGAHAGQGIEAVGVAESAEDLRAGDLGHAGNGGDDAIGVELDQQHPDPLVEFFDLLGEVQRQAGFHGDVVGQLGVVQLAVSQAQRLGRDSQQCLGVGVAPGAAGVAVDEPSQAWFA